MATKPRPAARGAERSGRRGSGRRGSGRRGSGGRGGRGRARGGGRRGGDRRGGRRPRRSRPSSRKRSRSRRRGRRRQLRRWASSARQSAATSPDAAMGRSGPASAAGGGLRRWSWSGSPVAWMGSWWSVAPPPGGAPGSARGSRDAVDLALKRRAFDRAFRAAGRLPMRSCSCAAHCSETSTENLRDLSVPGPWPGGSTRPMKG